MALFLRREKEIEIDFDDEFEARELSWERLEDLYSCLVLHF